VTPKEPPAGAEPPSAPPPRSQVVAPGARRPRLELVQVKGSPSEAEIEVIRRAIEESVVQERRERQASVWMRAGRAQGRRLGMTDYRDRFSHDDVWRLSARFPYGGREYSGLHGRGDAK
jgi:hypothetical protein